MSQSFYKLFDFLFSYEVLVFIFKKLKGYGEVEGYKLVDFLRNAGIRSNKTLHKGGYDERKK